MQPFTAATRQRQKHIQSETVIGPSFYTGPAWLSTASRNDFTLPALAAGTALGIALFGQVNDAGVPPRRSPAFSSPV